MIGGGEHNALGGAMDQPESIPLSLILAFKFEFELEFLV
jgi:hypothetical protein